MSKRSMRLVALIGTLAATAVIAGVAMRREPAEIVSLSDIATPANAQTEGTAGGARNPLAVGDMATFVFRPKPEPVADVTFVDKAGAERRLSQWKGKVVLLNLWATWCVPCRKEMPALDRLQAALGSDRFEVVALAVDRAGAAGAQKFLSETKVDRLALYVDSSAKASSQLKAIGLPTTVLIGQDGLEVGRLIGPAEWDGADAQRLVRSLLPN